LAVANQEIVRPSHLRAVEGMKPVNAVRVIERAIKAAPVDRDGQPRLTRKLVEETARKTGWKPRREWIAEQRAARTGRSPVPAKKSGQQRLERLFKEIVTQYSPEESVDRYGAAQDWDWFLQLKDWIERARATKP